MIKLAPVPALTLALALALPAAAQRPAAPAADPADPRAAVPRTAWRSSLGDYRRYVEPAANGSWRDANDTVTRIGGWRTYAREALPPAAPAGPASAASAAASPAASQAHGGHGGHRTRP